MTVAVAGEIPVLGALEGGRLWISRTAKQLVHWTVSCRYVIVTFVSMYVVHNKHTRKRTSGIHTVRENSWIWMEEN